MAVLAEGGPPVKTYPAISIVQPWLDAILDLGKPVENRTWKTSYRGPLLLHASKGWDGDACDFIHGLGLTPPTAAGHRGAIVGVAEFADICSVAVDGRRCGCGGWAMPGQHHWRLARACRFEPVAHRGSLGMWAPTPAAMTAIRSQLAEAGAR